MSLCASVDIKFTISPNVDPCFAEFEILRAYKEKKTFSLQQLNTYS